MGVRVRGPDGIVIEFPNGTSNETINTVMGQRQQEMDARGRAGNQQMGARPSQRRRNMPRSNNPQGSRELGGLSADNRAYLSARIRRAEQQDFGGNNAPEGSLERGLNDFRNSTDFNSQMWRNLGVGDEISAGTAWLGQAGENALRRVRGQPIEIPANTAAQAALGYERDEQGRVAREQPILNAASVAASFPAFGGNPVANLPRVSMLEAGVGAAGINAPFALGRQDGSLEDRLPSAALETAIVAPASAGLQGLANRFLRSPATNTTAQRATEFEQAGVRAPLAAVQGRQGAPMAMAVAENPVGGNVRRNLQNSVDDVQAAAQGMVQRAGNAEPREIAGEVVQRGVRRFANGRNEPMPQQQRMNPATGRMGPATPRQVPTRDWSFGAKSSALYDDVFGRLAADEQAMLQGGVQQHLSTTATQQTLQRLTNRVSGEASREVMRSPMLSQIQQALADDAANGTLRFQDLRAWRTWVREAQRNDSLRQGMANAELQQLERALTEDIYASAMSIGGQAADDLRVIDRWYRQTSNRINTALQPFDDASGGAQAFRRVIDLASQGGRQNTRQLVQLRESLRPDEWRAVSASIMDELGNPSFGNATIMEPGAFSLERFVTNVGRMSAEGRQALFGPQLARELENLARVAGYLKQVRGFANHSHSGSSIQSVTTMGAVGGAVVTAATGNAAPLAMLAGAGVLMRVTGEMLTNPAFVRWLTSPGAGGLKRQLAALATIASRDPAVAPLYTELVQRVGDRSPAPEARQPERTVPTR